MTFKQLYHNFLPLLGSFFFYHISSTIARPVIWSNSEFFYLQSTSTLNANKNYFLIHTFSFAWYLVLSFFLFFKNDIRYGLLFLHYFFEVWNHIRVKILIQEIPSKFSIWFCNQVSKFF